MWLSLRGRQSRFVAFMAALSLVATLAAACSHDKASTIVGETTATVHSGSSTTLTAAGVTMTLPDGVAAEGTSVKLTVRDGDDEPELPAGIRALGHHVSVDLPGALTEPATITFPAPTEIVDQSLMPVAYWQDGAGGWRWVPTTYDAVDRTVSANVDHFSWGFLAGVDIKKWASDRWDSFRNYVTGRAGVSQPHCGDEDAARAGGVQVASDSGDRVKWCFGVDGGRRVLRIANNTRTFLQMTYPDAWQVIDGTSVSFDADTVARALGATVSVPEGAAARIVDGGDTLTLAVPDGASGRVTTETSVVAWMVSAITFGIDTYTLVAKAAGSSLEKAAKSTADRFAVLLGATDRTIPELDVLKRCVGGARALVTLDGADAAWSALKLAWDCVPAYMESQLKDVQIFAAGVIVSMIGAAAGTILSAVHLLVTGARDLWDDIASIGGNSDVIYDIVIAAPTGSVPATPGALVAFIREGVPANISGFYEGGWAPGGPFESSTFPEFMTPSGNLSCALLSVVHAGGVTCQVKEFSYTPAAARDCGYDIVYDPHWVWLGSSVGQGGCFGGAPFHFFSNALPYGSTISDGSFACRSDQAFLACAELATGQGFVVSKTTFRAYGKSNS